MEENDYHSSNVTEGIKLTNFRKKFRLEENFEPLLRYLGRFDFYLAVRHVIYFILPICFIIIILDMTTSLITDTKDVMVEPLV